MRREPDLFAPGPAVAAPPSRELVVVGFAGGGGTCTGIATALGRAPDYAINHDAWALAVHAANHPATTHLCTNINKVDPAEVVSGRPVGLAWFSPDCKHFSKAKGGRPVKREIRDLAWVVVLWARRARPRVIMLENVEEFRDWGPITAEGRPCAERKGETFERWTGELKRLGYRIEWRELRCCDYGVPTTRKRFFLIARRDGRPIVWPKPTHGRPDDPEVLAGRKLPWRTAAEIIDWSLPCPSIFATAAEIRAAYGIAAKRPLAEATMARIAKGVWRYVLTAARPFIVPVTHAGDARAHDSAEPLRTQTTARRGEHAVVTPFLVPRSGERPGQEPRTHAIDEPAPTVVPDGNGGSLVAAHLCRHFGQSVGSEIEAPAPTVTAGGAGKTALVAAFLAQHNEGPRPGAPGRAVDSPVSTVTTTGAQQSLVAAHLLNMRGNDRRDRAADEPCPTFSADGNHVAEVRAFLVKYYGEGGQWADCRDPMPTDTTKARMGVVTVEGEDFEIVDIGMRMLTPRERFRAHAFPDDYVIDGLELDGRRITGEIQGRLVGNSVPPPMAAALVAANCADLAIGLAPLPLTDRVAPGHLPHKRGGFAQGAGDGDLFDSGPGRLPIADCPLPASPEGAP